MRQEQMAFPNGWGGVRKGAGRKPKGARAGVSHRTREPLAARYPVHVTVRLRRGLASLRKPRTYRALQEALAAGSERFGFRLVHYSVQSNHLHLMAEAKNAEALSRGMQGLSVRIAKRLNRLWKRRGRVLADRFHARILRTPREVRVALGYVLNNCRRHGIGIDGSDPYSSGAWFDGWRRRERTDWAGAPIVARARSWLLRKGWRRHGLLGFYETPGP